MSATKVFRRKVAELNGTSHRWSQGKELSQYPWARTGVCAPLVIKWMEARPSNQKFRTVMNIENSFASLMEVMNLKKAQHTKGKGYSASYLSEAGLRQPFRTEFSAGVPFNILVHHATLPSACYLIGVTSVSGDNITAEDKGHAFGMDMYENCFFDPNVGEAIFADADTVRTMFTWWWNEYYSEMKGKAYIEKFKRINE